MVQLHYIDPWSRLEDNPELDTDWADCYCKNEYKNM